MRGEPPSWQWARRAAASPARARDRPYRWARPSRSGPRHTSRVDPEFPQKLADYAARVAERFRGLSTNTVNEPLTTALFSGLYGVGIRTRAAITGSSGAAHAVQGRRPRDARDPEDHPALEAVQTDDLGKTYSTQKLRYQANSQRAAMAHLGSSLWASRSPSQSLAMASQERGCSEPSGRGLSSTRVRRTSSASPLRHERTLPDEDLAGTPACFHAGTDAIGMPTSRRHVVSRRGVTASAPYWRSVAALPPTASGDRSAHHASREDQLRWVVEIWRAADALRATGADVRAVTLWALFGVYDWNCLVSECRGYYEPGAFDVRSSPRAQPPSHTLQRASRKPKCRSTRCSLRRAGGSGLIVSIPRRSSWTEQRQCNRQHRLERQF